MLCYQFKILTIIIVVYMCVIDCLYVNVAVTEQLVEVSPSTLWALVIELMSSALTIEPSHYSLVLFCFVVCVLLCILTWLESHGNTPVFLVWGLPGLCPMLV